MYYYMSFYNYITVLCIIIINNYHYEYFLMYNYKPHPILGKVLCTYPVMQS